MKSNASLQKYLQHPWLFLLLSMLITITVKIPHLDLPYFMDEAFSYIPAIDEMAHNGPGLLPGSISLYASKGHPLLFYFLSSSWLKFMAGDSITLMRLFPLLLSLVALYVFHAFARRHTGPLTANAAVMLLTVQPLFLAQASLVLPEILLFILFTLTFDSYLRRQYGRFALFGSLTMLTKETGGIFIMVFGFAYLIENYRSWKTKLFWQQLAFMAVPVMVYLLFLVLHYLRFGVVFYTEHLNYITAEASRVGYKFNSATSTLFLAHGRNLLFFTAMAALLFMAVRKKKISHQRLLLLTLFIILPFVVFCILNFFTYRYVLPVMGISLLAMLVLIQQIKTRRPSLNIAFIACAIALGAYYTATKRGKGDADLGYTQFLVVQQQMVRYCEQQQWYDQEIGAGFNMVMAMRDPLNHYLSSNKYFPMHHFPGIENRQLIILDSTCEPDEVSPSEKNKLTLIKRFEYKKHWGEIYRVED